MADQLPPLRAYRENQTGALLYFKESVTREQAEKALKALAELTESVTVRRFDNSWGGPVWYIP